MIIEDPNKTAYVCFVLGYLHVKTLHRLTDNILTSANGIKKLIGMWQTMQLNYLRPHNVKDSFILLNTDFLIKIFQFHKDEMCFHDFFYEVKIWR